MLGGEGRARISQRRQDCLFGPLGAALHSLCVCRNQSRALPAPCNTLCCFSGPSFLPERSFSISWFAFSSGSATHPRPPPPCGPHAWPGAPSATPASFSASVKDAKSYQLFRPQRRRMWQPAPVSLPRESHGQRSLVGCCPWGRTELDTTEAT